MSWLRDYVFPELLDDLRSNEQLAAQLRVELVRELSPGHTLHEADLQVAAKALPQDDVVVVPRTVE